jgi:hypothetical protein
VVRPTDCVILLREVNTLKVSTRSTEPDLLAHDIRVIEFVTRQNQHPYWPDFPQGNVAIFHARNRAVTEIYRAVAVVVDAFVFENPHDLPQRIREDPPDGRVRMDLQAALELVSQLVADLPQHHADARRLKKMARRTQKRHTSQSLDR